MQLFAVLRKEEKFYVSWCPELDVASQGRTVEAALANLKEAVELYLEVEGAPEMKGSPIITTIEVSRAKTPRARRASRLAGA